MRTTVRLDPHLLKAAKKLAADSGRTLTAVIEDALREVIARKQATDRPPVKITVFGGGRLMPGVDLDSNAALQDLLDEEDDSLRR
jgi:hypothetical protein